MFTDQKSLLLKICISNEVSVGCITLVCFSAYTNSVGLQADEYAGDESALSILMCLVTLDTKVASVLPLFRSKVL